MAGVFLVMAGAVRAMDRKDVDSTYMARLAKIATSEIITSKVTGGSGGTYRSARLPVRGPPATGRYHQKSTVGGRFRLSVVD
ncbi:hypothetical protein BHE74_00053238 [Ensete ventricosum]|nr:hypothetical protein BHE74_00053238 [Ensete ventricosum]